MELSEINKSEVRRLVKIADEEHKDGHGIIRIETSSKMLYFLKRILDIGGIPAEQCECKEKLRAFAEKVEKLL